jgi:hypothetical protein
MAATDGTNDLSRAVWRKSSRSNGGQDSCIEIAGLAENVAVRDSKDPSGPVLLFGSAEWGAFLSGIKHGN